MEEERNALLARFLDAEGRVKQFPAKAAPRETVLSYLAEKFELGVDYKEREVNAVLTEWHTFGDYFILRRSLVEAGYLNRLNDGSRYWKNPQKAAAEDTAE
ncbi:MAG: DUF2087 domain-containing protein [Clostridiaceae bacterium]|nr:DUF2087 domain-containing protein [Eubacteriales bacterium]